MREAFTAYRYAKAPSLRELARERLRESPLQTQEPPGVKTGRLLCYTLPYFFRMAAVSSGDMSRMGAGFSLPERSASHHVESPSQPHL